MKIDRRSFLTYGTAMVLGGAAGSMLTPAPWKLMDDASIWTQNWPWTPVPEEGEVSYKESVCTLCPGGCGINVRLINGRPVKIEGAKDFPVNKGSLCPMGISGLQYLYGPSRVTAPMKRVGKRGEGKWKKISWEEALADISKPLATLRSQGRPQSLACIAGSAQGTIPHLISRFMTAYGSPNYIRPANTQDAIEQAMYRTQGKLGTPVFDIENADFILSFGCGLLDGGRSPGRMLKLFGDQQSSKQIIQIEPRLSDTAAKASRWIGINPGTEEALALGIAHAIIRESLQNNNFIENFAFGFHDWSDDSGTAHEGFATRIKHFTLDKSAQITGIDKSEIKALARQFAKAARPLAINGRGRGTVPGSASESMAVHLLNALAGNINKVGGVSVISDADYIQLPDVRMDEMAASGMQTPRIDGAGSDMYPDTRYLLNRLPEILNTSKGESAIQALFVTDANPLYTMPDTAATRKAFDRIPLIVSFSPYMDESAAYADYILPNHAYLERLQDVSTVTGISRQVVGLSKPILAPIYDTRHLIDTFIQIAGKLGGTMAEAFPWKNYEKCMKDTFKDQWRKLSQKGYLEINHSLPESSAHTFNTASGKFEFSSAAKAGKSDGRLPDYAAVPIEGDTQLFKLLLVPYDAIRLAGGAIANAPFMTKTLDDTVLKEQTGKAEINPRTAKMLGLKEGATALLETPKGKATVMVNLSDGVMPGIIAMPRGLGHTAYSDYLKDKGTNINDLIGPLNDPLSGLDTAWGIRARLIRI